MEVAIVSLFTSAWHGQVLIAAIHLLSCLLAVSIKRTTGCVHRETKTLPANPRGYPTDGRAFALLLLIISISQLLGWATNWRQLDGAAQPGCTVANVDVASPRSSLHPSRLVHHCISLTA